MINIEQRRKHCRKIIAGREKASTFTIKLNLTENIMLCICVGVEEFSAQNPLCEIRSDQIRSGGSHGHAGRENKTG